MCSYYVYIQTMQDATQIRAEEQMAEERRASLHRKRLRDTILQITGDDTNNSGNGAEIESDED